MDKLMITTSVPFLPKLPPGGVHRAKENNVTRSNLPRPCLQVHLPRRTVQSGQLKCTHSVRTATVICALPLNARCSAEQTQTVTHKAPTITHIPGKEKSPQQDDGGSGFPPRDEALALHMGTLFALAFVQSRAFENSRCWVDQTVTLVAPTITNIPGKEKSPQLDDGGTGFPPRDNDGGGGGGNGGGGGGNWSGGPYLFWFLMFLVFLLQLVPAGLGFLGSLFVGLVRMLGVPLIKQLLSSLLQSLTFLGHLFEALWRFIMILLNLAAPSTTMVSTTMFQQKIVMKVPMDCANCRKKALEIPATINGVNSVAVDREKDEVVVIGENVDFVCLVTSLRKKLRRVTILSVEQVNYSAMTLGE